MLKVGDIFQVPMSEGSSLRIVGVVSEAEEANGYLEGYQVSVSAANGRFYSFSRGIFEASKIILLAPAVQAPSQPAADEDDAEEAALADARAAEEARDAL